MAPGQAGGGSPPPEGSLEFLLLLSRVEAWVRSATLADQEGGAVGEDCASIWRAKVTAYEKSLLDRLGNWTGLEQVAAERYRSRIEELGPTLEARVQAERRAAQKASPDAAATSSVVASAEGPASAVTRAIEAREASARAEKAKAEAAAAEKAREEGSAVADPVSMEAAADLRSVTPAEAPWRQKGKMPGKQNAGSSGSQRSQYEKEMLEITDNMKGLAQSWSQSLARDSKVLEEIHASQDDSQAKVDAANRKGKAMLKMGSLSFLKTMIMLAVSIVIFFMMIPFIIFT